MSYAQIVGLIQKLPKEDVSRLLAHLTAEVNSAGSKEDLLQLLRSAPTWTDVEFEAFQEARDALNRSRLA